MEEKRAKRRQKSEEREEKEAWGGVFDIFEDMKDSFTSFFPPEFMEHMGNAGRENLLAVRSLINNALERLDKEIERTERRSAPS